MEQRNLPVSDEADTLVASASVGWSEGDERFRKIFEEEPLAIFIEHRRDDRW